jgi:hypothetical protein
MARKYSRDNRGRFAGGGGGGRSAGGASGGGGASKGGGGGKKKAAAPVAAAPKKKHPGPPPPAWSKEMLRQAGKDKKAQSAAAKTAVAKTAKAKTEPKAKQAANTIKPSSLRAAEKAYGEIKAQKSKFRSDKKVREEMIRRGFLKGSDPQGKLIEIGRRYRMRRGSTY